MNKPGHRPSTEANGRAQSHPAVDDHDLVLAARKGDRGAFRTLFDRYHGAPMRWRSACSATPTTRWTWSRTLRQGSQILDKFEGNSSFYTWLYRIVMNLAIDHLRKHRRVKPVELDEARLDEGRADETLLPRILGGNPGRALLDKEIRRRIDAALDELSDNHRAVLVMRELEGLSYEEMPSPWVAQGHDHVSAVPRRRNMQKRLIDLLDNPSRELIQELGLAPQAGEAADANGEATGHDPEEAGAARPARSGR